MTVEFCLLQGGMGQRGRSKTVWAAITKHNVCTLYRGGGFCDGNISLWDISYFKCGRNHLEERLLDQAQARASYTPLFWGHSRSIPQGMILDVQPLVKSFFCPIRASPNGFFDFEASTP